MRHPQHRSHEWRKATRSNETGSCVELADLVSGVGVRDSQDPDGPVLIFVRSAMADLAVHIRNGFHDL
nr:DUF397 domain-containing protein [Actinomadura atramentaria]